MDRAVRVILGCATGLAAAAAPLAAQQVVDLPGRDKALEPRLEDVYRVGSLEGADWELFGERVEVAFDGAGNLYVFDPENHRVVVADRGGKFLRAVGKEGEGPGELRNPAGFVVLRDGTVAIADMGHRAFVVYGPDGAFARSVPIGSEGLVILGRLFPDARGGAAVSVGQTMISMQRAGPGPAGRPPEIPPGKPIVRYPLSGSGGPVELHQPWTPPPLETATQIGGTGARVSFGGSMARAFEPLLLAGGLPDGGVAFSDSSAFAIKVVGPDGKLQRVLRRPFEPREVSRRMQDAEKERRLEELESGGGPQVRVMVAGPGGGGAQAVPQGQIRDMMRQRIEELQFYPKVPVVTALATGWSGKIWVERRARDVYAEGPVDVLTPAGEYLGTVADDGIRIPSAFGPGGLVAYVERDELDVPTVAVRRLPAELR